MSPQIVADAANIYPYPFAVRQERLPPDNPDRERNGKPKKSKQRPRAERNPRQEEEIRFNTGPRNIRGSPVNRASRRPFRMLGRHDRGYDDHNGIPDYPPPSFQEATMTTPPLSACSSTTTLVPVSIPIVLVPEDIPEVPEIPPVQQKIETSDETVAVSDHGSESDESQQIIDKDSVVCSGDLPKGVELEKRIKNDWKNRRGFDFPVPSSFESSQKQSDGIDPDRGRSTVRTPGFLTIDPNPIAVEDESKMSSPISPTKRRFLSLSPLRTMLSPNLMTDPDRPVSAHPSPCSSPYAASSRNIFFRSSTSLATASMIRLPLFPGKSDNSVPRKLFGKGKEKLDTWEVLQEDNYPDEFGGGGSYPSSLMSAIQSFKLSPSVDVGNSPSRSHSFSVGIRSPVSPSTKQFPNSSQGGTVHETPASSQGHQDTLLRDKKGPSGALLDRKIWRSPASASTATTGSMTLPLSTDPPPARPISPVTHPRVPSPTILKHTVPPIHPSPLRPTLATGDKVCSTIIHQQALDTPLPTTPAHRTHFDVVVNGAVFNDQEAKAMTSARPVPDILNDSFSAGDVCTCRSTTPLSLGTTTCLPINSSEEPMTPNRHHYTGRPLPRPPPSTTRSNVDSTFAPEVSVYDADREGRSSARCPEGLLINLDDTSLDDCSTSGASTPLSDGARLRSQLHLPITPPLSATELTAEPTSERSALSDSTVQRLAHEASEQFDPTELDLLISRLTDGEGDGSNYETLLLVSELIGPASPTHARILSPSSPTPNNANISLIGQIEVKRRRKTKDGRVKLKLSLFDVRVNKCSICLSQFREGDKAGLTSTCQHSYHEKCLVRWLARSKTCPLCRVPLDVDTR